MSRKLIALFASSSDFLALAAARPLAIPTDSSGDLPKEIVWMPAGTHEISCFAGDGQPTQATVLCDEAGAKLIAASFAAILAKGQRVYLDKDHKDEEATAWVTGFRWDPAQGIMAKIEWTSLGQELLRGKVYYSFSPAFMINRETKRVSRLMPGHAAGARCDIEDLVVRDIAADDGCDRIYAHSRASGSSVRSGSRYDSPAIAAHSGGDEADIVIGDIETCEGGGEIDACRRHSGCAGGDVYRIARISARYVGEGVVAEIA